jgi:hypothetical protein
LGVTGNALRMKITDYLAIYAAILSTVVFLWNIVQSRPRIKVDLLFSIDDVGGKPESGASIIVRNCSSHDVHLANISILYPYRHVTFKEWLGHFWRYRRWPNRIGWVHSSLSNYDIESGCPVCLEARKSHRVFIPDAKVKKMLSDATEGSLIACVQDQLWNDFYSRKFKA